jgi:hypothetical protein
LVLKLELTVLDFFCWDTITNSYGLTKRKGKYLIISKKTSISWSKQPKYYLKHATPATWKKLISTTFNLEYSKYRSNIYNQFVFYANQWPKDIDQAYLFFIFKRTPVRNDCKTKNIWNSIKVIIQIFVKIYLKLHLLRTWNQW